MYPSRSSMVAVITIAAFITSACATPKNTQGGFRQVRQVETGSVTKDLETPGFLVPFNQVQECIVVGEQWKHRALNAERNLVSEKKSGLLFKVISIVTGSATLILGINAGRQIAEKL